MAGPEQGAGGVVLEAAGFFYIALHGAVVTPAALAFDVAEVGAGAVRAGGHAAPQAVAGQIGNVIQSGEARALFEDEVRPGFVFIAPKLN